MKFAQVFKLLVLGCVMITAGCAGASQAATSAPTTPGLPEPHYAGALSAPVTYNNGRITLNPPQAGDVPAVDWREAYRHCSTDAFCELQVVPTISYGRATVTGYGDIQADGSTTLRIKDRLVYVLQYAQSDGERCPRSGPIPVVSGRPATVPVTAVADVPCTTISFIDAASGEALGASSWSD